MGTRLERAGVRDQGAAGVGLLVDQGELGNEAVEVPHAAFAGTVGEHLRHGLGGVHRYVVAGEGVGIDPRPEGLRPLAGIGGIGWRLSKVDLQRFHPCPEIVVEIVRRPIVRSSSNDAGQYASRKEASSHRHRRRSPSEREDCTSAVSFANHRVASSPRGPRREGILPMRPRARPCLRRKAGSERGQP